MTGCKKIDMDTWARREHYEYYTKQLKVEYNITANVDVKNVLDFCHSKGYKFYPAMIYLVTKTLNRIDKFKIFYQDILKDMATAATKKGIKAKEGQPANFYCISCTPWTTFTGYSSRVSNSEPSFFPIVLMGKYKQHGKKILMPVNITIAHAVADGYHVGLFFQYLQEEINNY